MRFDIITIFPGFFDCFLAESLVEKGVKEGLLEIRVHNLRDFTDDPHQVVDDRPFGGGIGMVYKIEPIYKAVKKIKKEGGFKEEEVRVVLFTPRGEEFTQKRATEYADLSQIIMICGRYEGVDERVAKYLADEEVSVGDYVLLGGEVPAMAVVEAVARLVPGVIGEEKILEKRVTEEGGFKEFAQYTRPRVFETEKGEEWKVPEVLLSGHHKKIEEWRKKHVKKVGEEKD